MGWRARPVVGREHWIHKGASRAFRDRDDFLMVDDGIPFNEDPYHERHDVIRATEPTRACPQRRCVRNLPLITDFP